MCEEDFNQCQCDSHNCPKHNKTIQRPIPSIQNTWIGLSDATGTSSATQTVSFPPGSLLDEV